MNYTNKLTYTVELTTDDWEYLMSFLDEEPQDSRENRIREEILLQVYD